MANCIRETFEFPPFGHRKIEAGFDGVETSRDGGLLLLREVDRQIGFLDDVGSRLEDQRDQTRIQHSPISLLKQRVYGLALVVLPKNPRLNKQGEEYLAEMAMDHTRPK